MSKTSEFLLCPLSFSKSLGLPRWVFSRTPSIHRGRAWPLLHSERYFLWTLGSNSIVHLTHSFGPIWYSKPSMIQSFSAPPNTRPHTLILCFPPMIPHAYHICILSWHMILHLHVLTTTCVLSQLCIVTTCMFRCMILLWHMFSAQLCRVTTCMFRYSYMFSLSCAFLLRGYTLHVAMYFSIEPVSHNTLYLLRIKKVISLFWALAISATFATYISGWM